MRNSDFEVAGVTQHGLSVDAAVLVERARALVPALRERARAAEALRRLPDETLADLEAAGLFLLCSPPRYGGFGHGIRTLGHVTRLLAQGCMSTAWVYSFYVVQNQLFVLSLPEEGRNDVLRGRPYTFVAAGAAHGSGDGANAVPAGDGYRLTGTFVSASGLPHAEHLVALSVPVDGEEGLGVSLVLDRDDVTVWDDWHVSGMAATGSQSFSTDDLFVSKSRAFVFDFGDAAVRPPDAAPLEGFSAIRVYDVAKPALAVGAAEAVLELFAAIVGTRVAPFGLGPQRERPEAWARYAEAATIVRTARVLWERSIDVVERLSERREQPSLEEAAHLRLAAAWICRLAREAIAVVGDGAGSSVNRHLDHPLQRMRRDLEVMMSHPILNWGEMAVIAGRALLGVEPVDHLLLAGARRGTS